ncbi:hypothetical protein U9M48_008615 [Paspalum notatum var. saurae]|uniref:Uncharacterized protein n=1 Tax=Paspalum notatum var. saurae TaxID=547442 RepID=A0AAQ3SPG7_PASNO
MRASTMAADHTMDAPLRRLLAPLDLHCHLRCEPTHAAREMSPPSRRSVAGLRRCRHARACQSHLQFTARHPASPSSLRDNIKAIRSPLRWDTIRQRLGSKSCSTAAGASPAVPSPALGRRRKRREVSCEQG